MAENINLEDFVLKDDANLHEFSVAVRQFLSKIATSPKVMLGYQGRMGVLVNKNTTYTQALEALQKLRDNTLYSFIDDKAILIMQATRKHGSPCEVIVNLKTSEINTRFFPDNAENELYEHIAPYLIKPGAMGIGRGD